MSRRASVSIALAVLSVILATVLSGYWSMAAALAALAFITAWIVCG